MVKKHTVKHPEKLEFTNLKAFPGIVHSVFTRRGGVSKSPFNSLNVSYANGDKKERVTENRNRIKNILDKNSEVVFIEQVHGDDILVLKNNEHTNTSLKADGIITDIKKKLLFIQVADCQSVMMYDPVNKVIANIHSGWRGSIKNIIGKCLDLMESVFGCNAQYIIAGIGPSLGPCCAEFVRYREELPEHIWKYKADDSFNFDFWELSFHQLLQKGVKAENIENMNICTKCFSKTFFSYRKEKRTGRFACVIGLV